MITFGKTANKPNLLFSKLPYYFKENDSYKDGNNEGLLERYMEIFCQEIDDNVSPYIEEVLDITDVEKLPGLTHGDPEILFNYISALFGDPPDVGIGEIYSGGDTEYQKLIRYVIHILRNKGTIIGLSLYLAIYGYKIDLITESPAVVGFYDYSPPIKYDDGYLYDGGFNFFSGYDLVITDISGTTTKNPTQSWLDNYLKPSIQKFISPMWAELGTLTYSP